MTAWAEEHDLVQGAWRLKLRMDKLLYHERSAHQEILLFENACFGRVLAIDGVFQCCEKDEFYYHEMLVHPPALSHGSPSSALIIGGGDGGALEELLKHDSITRVTMVEIDSSVVEFSKTHLRGICGDAFDDPRLDLVIADGVEWVKTAPQRYDLVFIDATDALEQGGPGEVLYTAPFYRDCTALLSEHGLLVTQNAVPFMEPNALARPYRALRQAFDATACYRVAVPSFYGGDMVFCLAARAAADLRVSGSVLSERFAAAALDTRYYTPEIHLGAFAMPPCLTALLRD